jgi:hypothetical protein
MANLTCETGAVVLHGYMGKFHIVQGVFFFHVFFPLFFFLFLFWFPPSVCVFDSGKFDMFVTCLVNNVWCTNLYDDETAFLV